MLVHGWHRRLQQRNVRQQQETAKHEKVVKWPDSQNAPEVERADRDRPGPRFLGKKQVGDEEPAEHEEADDRELSAVGVQPPERATFGIHPAHEAR